MKKALLTILLSALIPGVYAQDIIERIAKQVCNCIDTVPNIDSLQAQLDKCVPEAIFIFFGDADSGGEFFSDSDTIQKTVDKVLESLTSYCPKIREFVLADREARFYSMSDSEEANKLYEAGTAALNNKDYKTAEKNFLKAIRESPDMVIAYDDLGLTYRQMGDYKKAVRYYAKSLEIYPEGSYAIQNQAVAYTYLEEFESALENYNLLINFYPKNPEGYFGKGKTLFLIEDYENALDYLFDTHKYYISVKSEYAKDTETLISAIYTKMKDQNKLDVFNQKAREHGVTVE